MEIRETPPECANTGLVNWKSLGRSILSSTLVAACFPVIYFTYNGHLTLKSALIEFFVPWTFANCVSIPANLVPWNRLDVFLQLNRAKWAARIAVLLGLGVLGNALGIAIFVLVRLIPPGDFPRTFISDLPIVLTMTLLIGTAMIIYEEMREQLDKTALQLRTQELDRERALKLATEARLSSLESRLHPHFLFNTLNSISSLIPEDPERAEKLVERMAALLRFSLDSTCGGVVPLERELKIVNDYLEIEKARLGDRLNYDVSYPSDLDSITVPPLALQTLVENSIKHAIAPNRGGGWLKICVERSNGSIDMGVRDSGPGFDLQQSAAGHGLDNLRSRLTALYGGAASLSTSRDGTAASVHITIPFSRS